jgi:cbb3-type cytochrome oxidase subunit 1
MPRASQWLIRTALVHLAIGCGLGAWILAAKAGFTEGRPLRLVPLHAEMLVFGWMLQVVMGVAHWILPRRADRSPPAAPAWATWRLLNAGVLACAASHLLAATTLVSVGRTLEAAAVMVFVASAWPRVRPLMAAAARPGSSGTDASPSSHRAIAAAASKAQDDESGSMDRHD